VKKKETKQAKVRWDEVKCLKCGYTWNASDDEYFNMSYCNSCHNTDYKFFGGKYLEKKK